jgi:hypothetical protein
MTVFCQAAAPTALCFCFADTGNCHFRERLSLIRLVFRNGPERSRARGFCAAQRTLDGEDRSEAIYDAGKEELQLDSISEAQQAKRFHMHVATIVLSETRGL